MYSKSMIAVVASVGMVNAFPLLRRQETATASVTATETAATTAETTAAMTAETTAAMTAETTAADAASTPGQTPTASTTAVAGETYDLYPCPDNTLLTYAQVNQTVEMPIDEVNEQAGEWATSPIFTNVTESENGSEEGATHTYTVMGVPYPETLVESTDDGGSGSAFTQWVYNSTAAISADGIDIPNYQTVYKAYDPTFSQTGERGNTTVIQLFTNACASDQEGARSLLRDLHMMQLNEISGQSSSNGTTGEGEIITQTLETQTQTATDTNTAVATATEQATATESETQVNTVVPATATTVGATEEETVTPVTETNTVTSQTETSIAATNTVTSEAAETTEAPEETATATVATTTAA